MDWQIHHKAETVSTNLDARAGVHGDVFTADYQTAGRGRLDHKWLSPPRTNLMMSVVLDVEGLAPEHVATLPLTVGLAVARGVEEFLVATRQECRVPVARADNGGEALLPRRKALIKWPNDVLLGGRKVAGILCERNGDAVIVGIGVNVKNQEFPPEIANKAVSLGSFLGPVPTEAPTKTGSVPFEKGSVPMVEGVRDAILAQLASAYDLWRVGGFTAVYPAIREIDFLRGQTLSVRQTDDDAEPVRGVCGGICDDGSLDVGGVKIYAGEAHVEGIG